MSVHAVFGSRGSRADPVGSAEVPPLRPATGDLPAATLRIVCIEDEPDDVELIRRSLQRAGVAATLSQVDSEAGLLQSLESPPDVLLCDYSMPGFSAEHALALLAERGNDVPLLVVTRAIGEEAVVNLFRAGAKDYVAKGKLALLPAAIGRVLRDRALAAERQRVMAALEHANARLRMLSAHLVDAQERERTRIARELHDGLGQALTGIVLQLHAAARSDSAALAAERHQQAIVMAQEAIDQVRLMSFELRPAQLELLGFVAAVRATLERQCEPAGVSNFLRLRGGAPAHNLPAHAVALRIVQEALNNMLRHASATQVVVRLHFRAADRLVLTVGDDGCGFDARRLLAGGTRTRNLGLIGMIERAEMIGGRLRFRSTPGRGTTLRLEL